VVPTHLAFFIIDQASRKVVHLAVTPQPNASWVAQQMRNATPFGIGPRFIIRDRDHKYGRDFDRAAEGSGAKVVKTPVRTPRANAICERFLGSVRRECLGHVLVGSERHLLEILLEYSRYFNESRPHQGIGQLVPAGVPPMAGISGPVTAMPFLNGLHHSYRRAA
jgi:transposase InsO family protein